MGTDRRKTSRPDGSWGGLPPVRNLVTRLDRFKMQYVNGMRQGAPSPLALPVPRRGVSTRGGTIPHDERLRQWRRIIADAEYLSFGEIATCFGWSDVAQRGHHARAGHAKDTLLIKLVADFLVEDAPTSHLWYVHLEGKPVQWQFGHEEQGFV